MSELKQTIQNLFSEVVEKRSLNIRYGQKVMIAEVAKTFIATGEDIQQDQPPVCVIEAGTGTGKTLAYILSALPVAMHLEKQLVISTATVALQEQLINKDLPEIREHSGLKFDFALVKGRARYVCLLKLFVWEEEGQQITPMFFEDGAEEQDTAVDKKSLRLYRKMISSIDSAEWDGERDHWPEEIDHNSWRNVMANRQDCSNKKCPYYNRCSFFEARKSVNEADVIVTNHDLVMTDLLMNEGGILPSVESAFYIFDEGHHLPSKALNHFSSSFKVRASQGWLSKASTFLQNLQEVDQLSTMPKTDFSSAAQIIEGLQSKIDTLAGHLEHIIQASQELESQQNTNKHSAGKQGGFETSGFNDRQYYRFPSGQVPDEMRNLSRQLEMEFTRFGICIASILELVKEVVKGEENENLIQELSGLANLQERAENGVRLFSSYGKQQSAGEPVAKWVEHLNFKDHNDYQISYSPLIAANTLNELMWSKCLGVVITSATLTALGEFSFFAERIGLPKESKFFRISSPFDYEKSAKLVLPAMDSYPNQSAVFAKEVAAYVCKWAPLSLGTLVLFSSWKQLNEVCEEIDDSLESKLLVQGELSKEEILIQHKKKIDEGEFNVIFGLASFAEGIDLPGDYLTHVIVTKIPFSVPTDPIEESLAEWVTARGGNPFYEISIPEASLKLIQACGRLLRSETDSGRISILDKRIVEKSYGKSLLNALPPYKIERQ